MVRVRYVCRVFWSNALHLCRCLKNKLMRKKYNKQANWLTLTVTTWFKYIKKIFTPFFHNKFLIKVEQIVKKNIYHHQFGTIFFLLWHSTSYAWFCQSACLIFILMFYMLDRVWCEETETILFKLQDISPRTTRPIQDLFVLIWIFYFFIYIYIYFFLPNMTNRNFEKCWRVICICRLNACGVEYLLTDWFPNLHHLTYFCTFSANPTI